MKDFLLQKKVKSLDGLKKSMNEEEYEFLASFYGLNWEATASTVLESLSYEALNRMNKLSYTGKLIFRYKKEFEIKKSLGVLKDCVQWLEVRLEFCSI